MTCPKCHHPVVEMKVQGATRFVLQACTRCDHRSWSVNDQPASIDEVVANLRASRRIAA